MHWSQEQSYDLYSAAPILLEIVKQRPGVKRWKQIRVQVLLRLAGRLFSNLMQRSQSISLAMQARGFQGSESHTVHLGGKERVQLIPNVIALLALPLTIVGGLHYLPIVG